MRIALRMLIALIAAVSPLAARAQFVPTAPYSQGVNQAGPFWDIVNQRFTAPLIDHASGYLGMVCESGCSLTAPLPAGTNNIGTVNLGTVPVINVTVTPQAVTVTWAGGSVTTGGAFQSALATSSSRKGCQIQNTSSAIEFINSSGSPTTSNSNQINPFGTYSCSVTSNLVDQAAIEISGAVAGQTYVVSSW
jgi:hypothetical protein